MTSESTDWAVGCVVMGRFWGDMREPPIKFVIIHRTKHFVTVQRMDDWSDVHRKKLQKTDGEWCVRVGPLWIKAAATLTQLEKECPASAASSSASSDAEEPASSSPGPVASE